MTASAARIDDGKPMLRLSIREATRGDQGFVLKSWYGSWRNSSDIKRRRLRAADYEAVFDARVRHGVLTQPDTRILVAAAEQDPEWIWSWLCYTPGLTPTIHYALTRRAIQDDDGDIGLRRLGIFTRLAAAAGVRRDCVYTFRPTDERRGEDLERGLLQAAKAVGIVAVYRPVDDFLRLRRE